MEQGQPSRAIPEIAPVLACLAQQEKARSGRKGTRTPAYVYKLLICLELAGGEGGIRTLSDHVDSVSYRTHNATVAVNASDAVVPCTLLHASLTGMLRPGATRSTPREPGALRSGSQLRRQAVQRILGVHF